MSTTLGDALHAVAQLWPAEQAESWDAPGLISGADDAPLRRIRLAVDATLDSVDDAIESGADLLLVHHPLLLRGVTTVDESTYKGAVLARLIRANVALLAAHTNADVVPTGTSAVLARLLGLEDTTTLDGDGDGDGDTGIGRVGLLPEPMTLGAFAARVGAVLPATAGGVRVAGDFDREVRRVAVCAGAGDSYLDAPAVRAADVYVTADLRHHPASAASEAARLGRGPALVDVSHWASEWLWLSQAAAELRPLLPGVEVSVSDIRTDPWDFVIVQSTGKDDA
jgi:dinuclear metal center YbgI/SA1388 family protein